MFVRSKKLISRIEILNLNQYWHRASMTHSMPKLIMTSEGPEDPFVDLSESRLDAEPSQFSMTS